MQRGPRGRMPSVDSSACPAGGEPCPALREPDTSPQSPPPPPPNLSLQEDAAAALMRSGLISCFALRCSSSDAVQACRGRAAPPGPPPKAELRELIVRMAHPCPTPAKHEAVRLCTMWAFASKDNDIIHLINNRIWQIVVQRSVTVTHVPGRSAVGCFPAGLPGEIGDKVETTPGLSPTPGTSTPFSLWLYGFMVRAADRVQI